MVIILASIQFYLFPVVLITALLQVFGLILTLLFPKLRIWPPPSKGSWQFWFIVVGWAAILAPGIIVVGVLDWGTFWLVHWSSFIIGGLLASFGLFFFLWAGRTLNRHQSSFWEQPNTFAVEGPYQYTRNPQYVGLILFGMGIILITNSFMALIIVLLLTLFLLLAPFTEEPLLREQFGQDYEEYCKNVPRFIGKASFKRKSSLIDRR
ncbi:MAG: methyltransferase family protein [Candidatus Thorarchaeota archaeon]